MKKLMIVAAAVSLAAVAQAVTLDWGFGGKVWVSEDKSTAKLSTDYTGTMKAGSELCLIYVGQNKSSFALGADGKLADGQTVVDTIAYGIKTSGTAAAKGKWSPATSTADLANYSDGASFAIVFNNGGKYDYVYAVNGGTVGAAYQTAVAYADLSGKTALITQYATGSDAPGAIINGGAEPVPEPTSGLLLLVGMAGLALRRRRA